MNGFDGSVAESSHQVVDGCVLVDHTRLTHLARSLVTLLFGGEQRQTSLLAVGMFPGGVRVSSRDGRAIRFSLHS